jgi:hypothetical protein
MDDAPKNQNTFALLGMDSPFYKGCLGTWKGKQKQD